MSRLTECVSLLDQGIARTAAAIPELKVQQSRLSRLLLLVGGSLHEQLELKLKPLKLNNSEFETLMILFSSPDGCSTPGELCKFTGQGATNMTRIASALVKRNLVERTTGKIDRRHVIVRITATGRHFVKQMVPPMMPRLLMMYRDFSEADLRNLNRLLRKLANNLDYMLETTADHESKAPRP